MRCFAWHSALAVTASAPATSTHTPPPRVLVPTAAPAPELPAPEHQAPALPEAPPPAVTVLAGSPTSLRVAVPVGATPCRLVFYGRVGESPTAWYPREIERIDVHAGGPCTWSTIFRAKDEHDDGAFGTKLEGGGVAKPGAELHPQEQTLLDLIDFNFDGTLDLRVKKFTAVTNAGYAHWLFDKKRRTFVRNPSLDELGWVGRAEDGSQRLVSFERMGCCELERTLYTWSGSKVVPVWRERTWFSTDPNGQDIPEGLTYRRITEITQGVERIIEEGLVP